MTAEQARSIFGFDEDTALTDEIKATVITNFVMTHAKDDLTSGELDKIYPMDGKFYEFFDVLRGYVESYTLGGSSKTMSQDEVVNGYYDERIPQMLNESSIYEGAEVLIDAEVRPVY
mmetsp:Transcript_7953/g.13356  ORF Transcript_7953/g.13356 Transcript_7953/m.13356 type:complete len:117 (+) Transcript_7953:2110-2460(+)